MTKIRSLISGTVIKAKTKRTSPATKQPNNLSQYTDENLNESVTHKSRHTMRTQNYTSKTI